ncbi:MAG: lipase family protein [Prolixibacteraceae bacterium]|jgi:predicted esterase
MKKFKLFKSYLLIAVLAVLALSSCTKKDDPAIKNYDYFISAESKTSITKSQAAANFTILSPQASLIGSFLTYDVDVEKVTYKTTFQGQNIQASGLVCLPKAAGNYPILSFQNGTNTLHSDAPTEAYDNDIFSIIESVASMGFIVVVPDYIGFGASSQLVHPYLQAESSTQCILDMLRAAKEFASDDTILAKPSNDLFLFGYSQGGWATLELQKAIESNYSGEFNLVASSCGAGPYSLSEMNRYITSQTTYPTPYFLAYLLNAYTNYDLVSNPLSDFVQESYASKIPGLFDGEHEGGTINSELTPIMANFLTTEYRTEYDTNAKFAGLKSAFIANSIAAWNTTTPTHLYHGENDEVIPVSMSETMYADFKAKGADSKVTFTMIPDATHTTGIFPTGMETIKWFLSLKLGISF